MAVDDINLVFVEYSHQSTRRVNKKNYKLIFPMFSKFPFSNGYNWLSSFIGYDRASSQPMREDVTNLSFCFRQKQNKAKVMAIGYQ